MSTARMVFLTCALLSAGPDHAAIARWLGEYAAGAERIAVRWSDEGARVELGSIAVPVDGAWHETVPTFFVRHRVTWVPARQVLVVEEQHNLGALWRTELRLEPGGRQLLKVAPAVDGQPETILRTFDRVP